MPSPRNLIILTACVLPACTPSGATYSQAKPSLAPLAKGESRLIVYEESSWNMMPLPLYLDGNKIGESAAGEYVVTTIKSGNHMLTAGNIEADAKIAFDAAPGQDIYIKTQYNLGIVMNRPQLNHVDSYQAQLELPDLHQHSTH